MRFDWYSATFDENPEWFLRDVRMGLGVELKSISGQFGYSEGYTLLRGSDSIARVFMGGSQRPYLGASGSTTPEVVNFIRTRYPQHHVTRFDTSEDFDGPGTWDTLLKTCLDFADEIGLKVSQAGDWHRGIEGRTLYLGSRKSAVFARLYEKGKQLVAENGPDASVSPDLVRLEVVARPDGPARSKAAVALPVDVYGYSQWSQELARRIFGLDVERVHIKERRAGDDERALWYAVSQYGKHFERQAERLGSWEALGRWIHDEMGRQEKEK